MSYNKYVTEGDDDLDGVDTIVRNANIFLDGESVILPETTYIDDDYPDEISSINSSIHPNRDFAALENDPPKRSNRVMIQGTSPQTKSTTPSLVEEKSRTSKDTRSVPNPQNQPAEVASSSFVPLWIRQAPGWLKIVFLLSILLLLGAMVLVVVGLVLAMSSNEEDTSGSALGGTGNRTLNPTAPTVSSPVSTPQPTASPVSTMPSQADPNLLTFYLTMGEFEGKSEQLSEIPTGVGNSFLVQLGNWNTNVTENACEDMDFDAVEGLYSFSSVPVYFVVGDKEYSDCSDPSSALDEWRNELVDYQTEYWEMPPYQVSRSERNAELFAIELGNTVVLSINVGHIQADGDDREAERVSNESLRWIATLYEKNPDFPRNFIILSSQSLPGDDDQTVAFFESLLADIPTYELVQFYLFGPGREENLEILSQYSGIENLDVISLINQSWPLLRVSIDTSDVAEEPISVGYDSSA